MRVLVTGASGFVGCHTVAALVERGHKVRAFVRSPEKFEAALAALGSPRVETVVGDVLEPDAVSAALEGCEAVLNAANVYTFDSRRRAEMETVNLVGTRNVLDAATARGCDPVVHVSSFVVVLPHDGPVPADPPVAASTGHTYLDTKKAAEGIARRQQDRGAPVVTVYPGQVFGPNDPGSGEMVSMTRTFLSGPVVPGMKGRIGITDVRWLARLHAALVEPGLGPRRALAPGVMLDWAEFIHVLRDAAGRRQPALAPTPLPVAVGLGRVAQGLARLTGRPFPLNEDGPWLLAHWQPGDDGLARRLAGDPPPIEETMMEAVRSMRAAGQVDRPRATGRP